MCLSLNPTWSDRATRDYAGAKTAQLLLLLLACSAGMSSASSALLPSSFVMYFVTLAAAAVIRNRPQLVVAYAVVGVMLGWVVAGEGLLCLTSERHVHLIHPLFILQFYRQDF